MSRLAFAAVLSLLAASPVVANTNTEPAELRIAPPAVSRAAVRAKLLENRRANIARFHAYRIAGVYPSNVFSPETANIWRDQQGHYCAAATIIRASGEVELVERIAEENNFFRIADVTQGPVMDWILTSGFTQAELVMIQKPFRPVTGEPQLAPLDIVEIDADLREQETQRLAKLYAQIETKLKKAQRASLEAAVDRLLKRPDLARKLLAS
jgi:hypothetical protein